MPRTKIHSKNLQKAITRQLNEIELWFLHTALLPNVIYMYMKFEDTNFYTLEVMPRTKIQSENLQRAITPKVVGIELCFLYTALFHNVTYLCMKFEVTSLHTFEVMPQTRFRDRRTDGQCDSSILFKLYLWGDKNNPSFSGC